MGLLYVDLHADLNVPESVREGALDWMGMAHMLGEDGHRRRASPTRDRGRRCWVPSRCCCSRWGPDSATSHERAAIDRLALRAVPVDEVADDPAGAAARALAELERGCDRVIVHFDVDTIDFTDTPLSEETGRNQGLSYAATLAALTVIVGSAKLAGLTVTELNPAHVEAGAGTVRRLARDLATALAAHAGPGSRRAAVAGRSRSVRVRTRRRGRCRRGGGDAV